MSIRIPDIELASAPAVLYRISSKPWKYNILPDIWIFNESPGLDIWLVGEDPRYLIDYLRQCMNISFRPEFGPKQVINFIGQDMALQFLSAQIYAIYDQKYSKTLKNRFAEDSGPLFMSLPEAQVLSAVNSWPDPVKLEDMLFEAEAQI